MSSSSAAELESCASPDNNVVDVVISVQLSAISYQRSAISVQLSALLCAENLLMAER
jgi:hypothetical protein